MKGIGAGDLAEQRRFRMPRMPLPSGTRLGAFEIVAPLGEGGMGEVYRARDSNLGRDVAVKILPEGVALDPERLTRFRREAQVLASLNHPNIASIYGVEDRDDVHALILELVEGPTLADRLAASPPGLVRSGLHPDDALPIAGQIAAALEAAHELGIVHRDLKPANVKVRLDGEVKVLDFGLAKLVNPLSPDQSAGSTPSSPTLVAAPLVTSAGVILGTAAYMSPEQARGRSVDARTDIWAFGCVLYEMLAGRPAFLRDTIPDTLAAILEHEPDWTLIPPATPDAVTRLLRRCLQKDPKRRHRHAGDARLELEESSKAASSSISGLAIRREVIFDRLTDLSGLKESPALSPDGKMVAFVALVGGRRQIWIRFLSGGAPLQVTHDPIDHERPRWAADSSALFYYARPTAGGAGAIWEIGALGGPARRIAASQSDCDVSHDGGTLALFQSSSDTIDLIAVSRDGGRRECLARLPPQFRYSCPRWSHDDRTIAFQRRDAVFDSHLEIIPLENRTPREIARCQYLNGFSWLPGDSGIIYSSSRGSTLLYPPVFNLRTVRPDGSADTQATWGDASLVEPDLHQSGRLLASRIRSHSDIWSFPIEGSPAENTARGTRLTRQTGHVQAPSVSPDGAALVYLSDTGGHGNLWVIETASSTIRQITFERDPDVALGVPLWSPAGDWIAYIAARPDGTGLWLVRPDGSDRHQVVARAWGVSWSADGQWLYHMAPHDNTARLEKVHVDGGPSVFVRENTHGGTVSPDGQTIFDVLRLESDRFGQWSGDCEIRAFGVEGGVSTLLARIAGARVPVSPHLLQTCNSPDGQWLGVPLVDGATGNIWLIPSTGGPMRQVTSFGDRSTQIARSVSWSADSRFIYAAVAELEPDIVLLDGLLSFAAPPH